MSEEKFEVDQKVQSQFLASIHPVSEPNPRKKFYTFK